MITVLRNASMNSLQYKSELALIHNQNIDITNFEEKIENGGHNLCHSDERKSNILLQFRLPKYGRQCLYDFKIRRLYGFDESYSEGLVITQTLDASTTVTENGKAVEYAPSSMPERIIPEADTVY